MNDLENNNKDENKILTEIDSLIEAKNYELVKDRLYTTIFKYQREGILDKLNKFAYNLTDVLIHIFKHQISVKEIGTREFLPT